MIAQDVFAGPILRRASSVEVAVWFATFTELSLTLRVRRVGETGWEGSTATSHRIRVFDGLWVHLLRARAVRGAFRPGVLLEYSIGVVDGAGGVSHDDFARIVAKDGLAYRGLTLPTFFLQRRGTPLRVLYGSCRKPHGIKAGNYDALAAGDALIAKAPTALDRRPTILCLGGDQIYADDVHDATFDALTHVAAKLEAGSPETLPLGAGVPSKGARQEFVAKRANFTSDAAANHLITFAEYVAMYGLAFHRANWGSAPVHKDVATYVSALPAVRRLLASIATYLIFDDHDVTDDWNLSVDWIRNLAASAIGTRIESNALAAYWLCQAWGNDPAAEEPDLQRYTDAFARRVEAPSVIQVAMAERALQNRWEFSTPTEPAVYFVDTRTQRGFVKGFSATDGGAPAFLKRPAAWRMTFARLARIVAGQPRGAPVVLVTPGPIFGFRTIDCGQRILVAATGPYAYDYEGWSANFSHLVSFLAACGNADVVVLSGDVHYAFTATARFSTFEGEYLSTVRARYPDYPWPAAVSVSRSDTPAYASRYIQLNSSGLRNNASDAMAIISGISGYHSAEFIVRNELVDSPNSVSPAAPRDLSLEQWVNDAYNTPYIGQNNLGLATFEGRVVENVFFVGEREVGARRWNFESTGPWRP